MQIPVIAAAVIAHHSRHWPDSSFRELSCNHYAPNHARGVPVISAFWHRCIIPSAWYWRNQGVVVMNTTNFDGQWTRKVIEHFGFGTAQGSSTRGGLRGLAVMARRLEEGLDVAFTIDGPRGPRYVAKPGPGDAGPPHRQADLRFSHRVGEGATRWKKPGTDAQFRASFLFAAPSHRERIP